MPKAKPKTGEKRETNQPLKIDRLPASVHDAILFLRNTRGKTWMEIADLSAEPYVESWQGKGGGFIDWPALSFEVLQLFPDMRLAHTSLHRWYDLRVSQVSREVLRRSAQAREIAVSFAKSQLVNGDEAVINAARDTLMGVLSEDGTQGGRLNATKGLIKLGELMQKAKTNTIRDRKVTVDEQTLKVKLDEIKRRTEKLIATVEGGESGAPIQLTREQLLDQVRGIYGIA